MEAATIKVKGELGWSTLPKHLAQLPSPDLNLPGSVRIDLQGMTFCRPVGAACLAAIVFWLKHNNVSVTGSRPRNKDVEQYLTRINFYKVLDRPEVLCFNRNDCSSQLVELTRLTQENDCLAMGSRIMTIVEQGLRPPEDAQTSIRFIVAELTENVFHHARTSAGTFVCCQLYRQSLELAFVDLGRGIRASLRDNPSTESIVKERGPLKAALAGRITGRPTENSGFGLYWVSQLVQRNSGQLGILSHHDGLFQSGDQIEAWEGDSWPGTIIHVLLSFDRSMDMIALFNRDAPEECDYQFLK